MLYHNMWIWKSRYRTPSLLPGQLGCRRTGHRRQPLFFGSISVLASTEISMLASGTKPAVDHGATECDFVMKERILSPIEKTCLRWISRGRTVAEIASLEGKSVAFIENRLQNALVALKAKSIEEALQKADLGQSD